MICMARPFAAFFAACVLLAGCSGGAPDTTEVSVKPESLPGKKVEGKLKVALLTPASVNDSGWSAIAYHGLMAVKDKDSAEVNQEVTKDANIKDAMRNYAQNGYNLVIGHGFEYNAPALEVAKDFPDTVFVTSGGAGTAENVGAIRFYLEEGFYLAGMIAGKLSKTGKVGMIGGPDVPSIRSTFKAFAAGAKESNPTIVVIEKFTGKNDDVAAAQQATLQAIDEGADVLIHQTNSGVSGFVKACEERKVWCFGANEDQNKLSKQFIASAIVKVDEPFLDLAQRVKDGTYKGAVELVGMKQGGVDFIFNPVNASVLPAGLKETITERQLQMVEGVFKTPKDEF